MFDFDAWQEIWITLSRNKLRTLLTAFGVFWGIFMLVVMLGSGSGLENGISAGFGDGATNSFFMWTRSTSMPYRGLPAGRRYEFNNDDTVAIREQIAEAKVVAPRAQLGGHRAADNVTRGNRTGGFSVMGDVPEYLAIEPVKLVAGRFLNPFDVEEIRKVAVIGSRVKEVLFEPDEDPIGDSIQVQGVYFKVIGVFESLADGEDAERQAQSLFIPLSTFQRAFNGGERVHWYAIAAQDGVRASEVEAKVMKLLAKRHRIHPEDQRAFGHFNQDEQFQKVQGLFAGIRLLVWIVGIGTLAAGVIGVSNILLILVKERTKEIGLRRAIGATPMKVIRQVLLEALVLTSIAGYFGLLAGVGLLELARSLLESTGAATGAFQNPGVDLATAVQALLILIASGALAGLIPARRAVSVSPVIALRTE
ncbi:MAG: ABC transporter permease [Acidobacteriota bacterium]